MNWGTRIGFVVAVIAGSGGLAYGADVVITTNDDAHVQRVQEPPPSLYGPDYVWNTERLVSKFSSGLPK